MTRVNTIIGFSLEQITVKLIRCVCTHLLMHKVVSIKAIEKNKANMACCVFYNKKAFIFM